MENDSIFLCIETVGRESRGCWGKVQMLIFSRQGISKLMAFRNIHEHVTSLVEFLPIHLELLFFASNYALRHSFSSPKFGLVKLSCTALLQQLVPSKSCQPQCSESKSMLRCFDAFYAGYLAELTVASKKTSPVSELHTFSEHKLILI